MYITYIYYNCIHITIRMSVARPPITSEVIGGIVCRL